MKKVILPSLSLLSSSAEIITLIKPQFETEKKNLKKGIVKDKKIHKEVCNNIEKWFVEKCNAKIIGLIPSPITGPKGNVEFLIYSLFNKP